MMNDERKYYPVKSIKLMTWLIRHGFDLYSVRDDFLNQRYKVFIFKNSKELKNCIGEFNKTLIK